MFQIVVTGVDGYNTGYWYREYVIIISFSVNNTDEVILVEFGEDINMDVSGAKIGMTFAEIQEHLPESEICQHTYIDREEDIYYALQYEIGNVLIIFEAGRDMDGHTIELYFIRKWSIPVKRKNEVCKKERYSLQ